MDTIENAKGVLIINTRHIATEQMVLNDLYDKLVENQFEYSENIELPYITQYLEDFNRDKKESFCASREKGKTGMSTSYLIDTIDPEKSNNSAIVVMDKETYDVLGVLSFNYIHMSDIDHDYDNSLYIDSFCTNQQITKPGIGKLLLTSIIKATTELGVIDNIFLKAATKHSEGFYEKFKFRPTGIIDDEMKEYKYTINSRHKEERRYSKDRYGGKRTIKHRRKTHRKTNTNKKTNKKRYIKRRK
jgi:hypothetical protein